MGTLGREMEQNTKTGGLVLYSVYRQMSHAAKFFCVRMWAHLQYDYVTKGACSKTVNSTRSMHNLRGLSFMHIDVFIQRNLC